MGRSYMDNSWIKLHRKFLQSPLWKYAVDAHMPHLISLWCYLLLSVNWEEKKWYDGKEEIIIPKGSLVTSLQHLADGTHLTVRQVRVALQHYENMKMMTRKTTNKWTQVWIVNWSKFQMRDESNNKQDDNPMTNEGQTDDKRMTTTKEIKNIRSKDTNGVVSFLNEFNTLFKTKFRETPARSKKYTLRRKSYSEEEIATALRNMASNTFYKGENERGWRADPDFLLRNDEQIDKFLNMKAKEIWTPGFKVFKAYENTN